jgi:hypothetical protein
MIYRCTTRNSSTRSVLFALFAIGCITLAVFGVACKKHETCKDPLNPDCPNYMGPIDPCRGHLPVSAEFTICQKTGGDDSCRHVGKDVLCGMMITLTAEQINATEVKWLLGRDTVEGSSIEFYFADSLANGTYPVTLIVKAPIDSVCNPLDNGMDTITKYINVHSICSAGWEGHWRGNMSGYDHPVDITLRIDQQSATWYNPCRLIKTSGISYFTEIECWGDNPTTYFNGCWNYFYVWEYDLQQYNISCMNDIVRGWVSDDNNQILLSIGQLTDSVQWKYTPRTFVGQRVN